MLGQEAADEAAEVARLVAVAGQRRGRGGVLDQLAQAGAAGQIAGLEHDEALLRRQGQEVAHGDGREVAGVAHPHQPPPAQEAHGLGLLDQPAGALAQVVAAQLADPERVLQVVDDARREAPAALGDQAGIGAVEQHRGDARVRPGDEAVDRLRLELHAAWFAK